VRLYQVECRLRGVRHQGANQQYSHHRDGCQRLAGRQESANYRNSVAHPRNPGRHSVDLSMTDFSTRGTSTGSGLPRRLDIRYHRGIHRRLVTFLLRLETCRHRRGHRRLAHRRPHDRREPMRRHISRGALPSSQLPVGMLF
jgi:hypothetical protein